MGGYIGLTCSLELGVAFWTRWKLFGSVANLIGPRGKSVSKGQVMFETATVLHDTTLCLLRVLRRRVHSRSNPNMLSRAGQFPGEHKSNEGTEKFELGHAGSIRTG